MKGSGLISVLVFTAIMQGLLVCYSNNAFAITSAECEARVNDTRSKLVECIQKDALWQHLIAFQNISDSNPDPTFSIFPGAPHGSRDAGTAGDIASVQYIVNKMVAAGYTVSTQSYYVPYSADRIIPVFQEVSPIATSYVAGTDFSSAIFSGSGDVTAQIQAVAGIIDATPPTGSSSSGCSMADFAGFVPGRIALMQRGICDNRTKVLNAIAAGAVGAITMNYADSKSGNTLSSPYGITVPVFAYIPYSVGIDLYHQAQQGPVVVQMKADVLSETRTTYNVIADSKGGDPNSVLVVDAHYDSIFGAGILDNASGSATILEIALKMQNVTPRNKVRFIWFGGEEVGLYGSWNYINALPQSDLSHIAYVMDADVTATPNYVIGVNFPAGGFPSRTYKASRVGYNQIVDYFNSVGLNHEQTDSDGTDSYMFNLAGIPGSGILTGQDCCKAQWQVDLFGGFTGNFEGNIPSYDGGCVDNPYIFCDNLANNDPDVLEFMSKGLASSVIQLVFDNKLKTSSGNAVIKPKYPIAEEVGRHYFP